MKRMAAGSFKIHCLAVMDEVQAKRESVVITKHGKPVAKLVPVDTGADDIYGFMAGKGRVVGDVVSPTLSDKGWAILSDPGGPASGHDLVIHNLVVNASLRAPSLLC